MFGMRMRYVAMRVPTSQYLALLKWAKSKQTNRQDMSQQFKLYKMIAGKAGIERSFWAIAMSDNIDHIRLCVSLSEISSSSAWQTSKQTNELNETRNLTFIEKLET